MKGVGVEVQQSFLMDEVRGQLSCQEMGNAGAKWSRRGLGLFLRCWACLRPIPALPLFPVCLTRDKPTCKR